LSLNVEITDKTIDRLVYQKNNHDCGPFICAYAVFLSNNHKNFDSSIICDIRKEIIEFHNSKTSKTSSKHGGGMKPYHKLINLKNAIKHKPNMEVTTKSSLFHGIDLKTDKPCLSYLICQWFLNRKNIYVLATDVIDNLISQNNNFILNNLSLKMFVGVDCIVGVVPNNEEWCLYLYSRKLNLSCIFDFTNHILSERLCVIGENLTFYMNKFFLSNNLNFAKDHGNFYVKFKNINIIELGMAFVKTIERLIFNVQLSQSYIIEELVKYTKSIEKEVGESLISINYRISNSILNMFFDDLNVSSEYFFIDSTMCSAILDDFTHYMENYLDFHTLFHSKVVFAVYQPPKHKNVLLVIDYNVNEHYILTLTLPLIILSIAKQVNLSFPKSMKFPAKRIASRL